MEEPPPAAERGDLLLELARAEAAAGAPAAIDRFESALEHVRADGRRVAAWHGLSRLLYARGDLSGAADAAARGRAELSPEDPRADLLLADELTAATLVAELAAAGAAATEALVRESRHGRTIAEPTLLAHMLVYQGWRGLDLDRVPALARAAAAADPLVDPDTRGVSMLHVSGALNVTDELHLARELLDAAIRRAADIGDPIAEATLRCSRAWTHYHCGRLAEAAADIAQVVAGNRPHWGMVAGMAGPPLIRVRLEHGDLPGARSALRLAERGTMPGLEWFQGWVAFAEGDAREALDRFLGFGEHAEGVLGLRNPAVVPWRSAAALAAHRIGEADLALELARHEAAVAREVGVRRALGIALRAEGLVTAGEDGMALLEESVAVLGDTPARLELAYSLAELGAARRRARATTEAREPLVRALELADACGATVLAERALMELRATGARPRRRALSGPAALTPTEQRVASLAATGATTPEIARTLFVAPKTVENHLSSIFRKLGVRGRSELPAALESSVSR
jgi:DNA-binding CsgD family transcriptional regulator